MKKIILLRLVHGAFAAYFISCLFYLYYAAICNRIDALLFIAILSLIAEGVAVFVLNRGDYPLAHIQRKLGDEVPFFQLFLPKDVAKKAVPFLAKITWLGLFLIAIRLFLLLF